VGDRAEAPERPIVETSRFARPEGTRSADLITSYASWIYASLIGVSEFVFDPAERPHHSGPIYLQGNRDAIRVRPQPVKV
jgi:hypothetical protein